MAAMAWLGCFLLERPLTVNGAGIVLLMALVRVWFFVRHGMYRAMLRYSGLHTALLTAGGIAAGTVVGALLVWFAQIPNFAGLGRGFFVMEALLSLIVCGGSRMAVRLLYDWRAQGSGQRVLFYGAGELGAFAARMVHHGRGVRGLGFIDDNPRRLGMVVHGLPVLGGLAALPGLIAAHRPDMLLIATQTLPQERLRETFRVCMAAGIHVQVARPIQDLLTSGTSVRVEELKLEELMRRPQRSLPTAPVAAMLRGQVVLVTGAGGSIGSELCRQIAAQGPAALLLLDHGEFNLYQIEHDLRAAHPTLRIEPLLLDLGDAPTLQAIMAHHRPQAVFHAAAYKHVPMVEANPFAGLRNNVVGLMNLLDAVDATGVERLVMVSTDKAVRPTSVMGASKRVCELLVQNKPLRATRACAVRFGNVLGSSGSVIPLFLDQIRKGGPVTVTDPGMTRYFMLIPEAVELVLQAGAMAAHGEVFILDMGDPVRIADLARQLIFMTGHVPDRDIAITYTGLRPGEKLYEELLHDPGQAHTPIEGVTVAAATVCEWPGLERDVQRLLDACVAGDRSEFVRTLRRIVPEWTPSALVQGAPVDGIHAQDSSSRASAIVGSL